MRERSRFDSEIKNLIPSRASLAALPKNNRRTERTFPRSEKCLKLLKGKRVAVVGGGLAGLMAARKFGQNGIEVHLYEARPEVGGRVLSNHKFSRGRIVEEGAELIGSFHTTWLKLTHEYGLSMISRMEGDLHKYAGLAAKLRLDRGTSTDLPQATVRKLEDDMRKIQILIANEAKKVRYPDEPWLESDANLLKELKAYDKRSVADTLKGKPYNVIANSPLWRELEFLMVNDEVAPLEQMNFLGLLCKVKGGQGETNAGEKEEPPHRLLGRTGDLSLAEGCQTLATRMAGDITKKYKTRSLPRGGQFHTSRSQNKRSGSARGRRHVLQTTIPLISLTIMYY